MYRKILSLTLILALLLLLPSTISVASGSDKEDYAKTLSYEHLLLSDLVYENLDECKGKKIEYCSREIIKNYESEIKDLNKRKGTKGVRKIVKNLNDFKTHIKPGLDKNLNDWKVITIQGRNFGGLYGVAFQNPKTDDIVIAFRGTQLNFADISYDFFAVWLNYTEIIQLKPACKFVKKVVDENKKSKFYLTGHSLGGFLAQRVAVEIQGNPDIIGYPDIINVGYTANFPKNLNNNFEYAETFNAPGVQLYTQASEFESAKREQNLKLLRLKEYNFRIIDHAFKEDKIGNYGIQLGKQKFYNYKGKSNKTLRAHGISLFYKESLQSFPLKTWDEKAPIIIKVNSISSQSTRIKGMAEANAIVTIRAGKQKLGKVNVNKYGKFEVKIPKLKAGTKLSIKIKDHAGNEGKEKVTVVKDKI